LSAWQGQLSQLSLNAGEYGQWALMAPVDLSLTEDQASLGDSCLQAMDGNGRLCVQGQWIANGDTGMQGRLKALPLEVFMPDITGNIDGDLSATLAAGGALRVDSAITLSAGVVQLEDNRQLAHGGGKFGLQVTDKGLRAELELATPEQGQLRALAKLPALHSLPMADEQPLAGSINAVLPDLSGLAAWVPEVGSSAGRLAADAQLAGSLSQPRIEGTLALQQGAATLPLAGLKLEHIELQISSDREQPDQLTVSGGLRSGPGQLDLSGSIDLAHSEFELALSGDRLQVFDTPDARALLTPDLQIAWRENTLNLRGQLTIPEAAITPKIQFSPAALGQGSGQENIPGQLIGPSPDVVVVSESLEYQADAQLPAAPFRIDSNIRVLMGEDVRVSAVGFVSQITGSVEFINTPEQEDLIPLANGRFSLQDGTFRAFGQDLEIETGHLIFANVPANKPELNLRAVRWIDNDPQVTAAGVLVTGTLNQPSLELFSRPQLEASEIQSYLLTGRSPSSKNNVLGVGTYVSPRIYVGYGYNMLERTSEFNSLFNISPRYGVGSSVGEADNNINMTITYEH
jgi:translocation and assembly module TamB